jgi:hypothetical protein
MKPDQGLEAVRRARQDISSELGNDPARLVAHYMELQKEFKGQILAGPEHSTAQQGNAADEETSLAPLGRVPRG